jgi:hypothetical protein
MLFAIGFVIGCAAAIWIFIGPWALLCAAVCFALCIASFCFKDRSRIAKIVASICVGIFVGACWMFVYDAVYIEPARSLGGSNCSLSIEVTDYSSISSRGTFGKGKTKIAGRSYKIYYYLSENCDLFPGDQITGDFYLTFTGFRGENDPTYHQGDGIFLIASAKEQTQVLLSDEIPVKFFPAYFRKNIIEQINEAKK